MLKSNNTFDISCKKAHKKPRMFQLTIINMLRKK